MTEAEKYLNNLVIEGKIPIRYNTPTTAEAEEYIKITLTEMAKIMQSFADQERENNIYKYLTEQSILLLTVAKCPNCDGSGAIMLYDDELEQCEWCGRKDALIEEFKQQEP